MQGLGLGRIPDIETIRTPDIRLIFNAGYLIIRPDIRKFAGYRTFARYPAGTGYPALEISRISGIRPKNYPAQP